MLGRKTCASLRDMKRISVPLVFICGLLGCGDDGNNAADAAPPADAVVTIDAAPTSPDAMMDAAPPDAANECSAADNGTACTTCGAADCQCIGNTCVSVATSCYEIKQANTAATDGSYWIDADGVGAGAAFQVYCNMSTDNGGWTLVDNDAVTGEIFSSREAGANPDFSVTRGSLLPAYTWSPAPQLLCISDVFDGLENWVTLAPTNADAMTYPTTATGTDTDTWSVVNLNGNTNQGLDSYTFVTTFGNFGALWIGNAFSPTCACNYTTGGFTSIGAIDVRGSGATCSTWVR